MVRVCEAGKVGVWRPNCAVGQSLFFGLCSLSTLDELVKTAMVLHLMETQVQVSMVGHQQD